MVPNSSMMLLRVCTAAVTSLVRAVPPWLGTLGGGAIPTSPAGDPIEASIKATAAKANRSVFYTADGKARTAGEVVQLVRERFGAQMQRYAGAAKQADGDVDRAANHQHGHNAAFHADRETCDDVRRRARPAMEFAMRAARSALVVFGWRRSDARRVTNDVNRAVWASSASSVELQIGRASCRERVSSPV